MHVFECVCMRKFQNEIILREGGEGGGGGGGGGGECKTHVNFKFKFIKKKRG